MNVRVICYAGRKADESPERFYLDEHEYRVETVEDQWYGPDASYFKVRASDGNLYILSCRVGGEWRLESFRKA